MAMRYRRRRPARRSPMARKRRNFRRRVSRKRKSFSRPQTKFLSSPAPDRLFTKLRYSQRLNSSSTVESGTGTLGALFWQGSLYDPDFSGVGHQALWRDQWALFFQYYRVHGIKYRISVSLTSGSPDNGFWSAVMHYNNLTGGNLPTNNFETEIERKTCRGKHFHIWSGNGITKTYTGYMSIPKTNGLTHTQFMGNPQYYSNFGADPAQTAYIALLINGYKAVGNFAGTVDLTFYTEMWQRLNVAGS